MQIAVATDMNYVTPTLVTVMSVLKHATRDTRVFVLGHNLTEPAKSIFKQIEAVHWNAQVRHIAITDDMLPADFAGWGNVPHMTSSCLTVLFVPKLIREGRVLYLDSDTMAFGDVAELFDMSMNGSLVAGVRNLNAPQSISPEKMKEIMGGRGAEEYFNSGVVLFDCDAICQQGLDEEVARIEGVLPDYEYPDQDRLNKIFAGKSKILSYKWNMALRFGPNGEFKSMQRITGIDPVIRHYLSPMKPWRQLEMTLFEDKNLILEYGMDVLEYREQANDLLTDLFGQKANVMLNYNFETGPGGAQSQ